MSVDRVFLDTNIFVYASDRRHAGKSRRAEELIVETIDRQSGVVSYQVLQEFFNVALTRFAKPMTVAEAERYLSSIFQPLFTVQSSPALLVEALRIRDRYRLSWYDALIVAAAVGADCAILCSEDLQDGQRFGSTRVKNPFV